MARKPARLERAGALTPRDRMWSAIRALQSFSALEVQFLVNLRAHRLELVHVDSVVSYLEGLKRATPTYVVELPEAPGRTRSELRLYELVRDVGVEAPRVNRDGRPVTQGLANELLWGAMKVLREFDHGELAETVAERARAAGITVAEETAKTYCTHLARAGYLALVAPAVGGKGAAKARYRFNRAMNSGPRAPLITKAKEVMDANTGAIVQPKGDARCRPPT